MGADTGADVRGPRTRDPERKQLAILEAAREVFAERGYAGATIREIARRAGVTHGLVVLHFQKKELLFRAAMAGTRNLVEQVQGDRSGLPRRIASAYVQRMESSDKADPFIAIIRASADQDAARMLLGSLREESTAAYAQVLDTDDIQTRVDLVGSFLIGVTLSRYVLGDGPLAALPADELVDYLSGPLTSMLLDPLP